MQVKICGLRDAAGISASVTGGASYLGFNFFPRSPRSVSVADALPLMQAVPEGICKVALSVNASDALLEALVGQLPIDMLQLHGQESPARVAEVKSRFGLPVMKALGIADASDLPAITEYARVSDMLLIDAKPPKDAVLPGGNGLAFDWTLLAGRRWALPWMLAGGLTADNVAEAARLTGADIVDVSSGVEKAPGVKDVTLIKQFLMAAKG
jgi:phosphoribosylanthranilate isomerase